MKSVRVFIRGRVQGVWYRGWTCSQARELGIAGWVRNRSDGRVEALFSGPDDAVEEMLSRCRQGPPAARVDGIDVEGAAPPDGEGFAEAPTV